MDVRHGLFWLLNVWEWVRIWNNKDDNGCQQGVTKPVLHRVEGEKKVKGFSTMQHNQSCDISDNHRRRRWQPLGVRHLVFTIHWWNLQSQGSNSFKHQKIGAFPDLPEETSLSADPETPLTCSIEPRCFLFSQPCTLKLPSPCLIWSRCIFTYPATQICLCRKCLCRNPWWWWERSKVEWLLQGASRVDCNKTMKPHPPMCLT